MALSRVRPTVVPLGRPARLAVLVGAAVTAILALALYGPVPQPPSYNAFADQRAILGIPNFWNVVSNLAFVIVGCWGLTVLGRGRCAGVLGRLRAAWLCLFGGAVLVGVGSTYYHLAPSDATLAWDRLPMTIVFMALFAIVMGEWVGLAWGARLLAPLVLVGVGSVVYWRVAGDLRPYILVQYLPGLLIPIILLMFRPALRPVSYLWAGLGLYVIAKALEVLDGQIYRALGGVGGHPLKHLVAACSIGAFVLAACRRRSSREATAAEYRSR